MDNVPSDAGGETYGGAEWDEDDGQWDTGADGVNGSTTLDGDSSSGGRPMTTATPDDAGGETYGGPEWDTGTATDTDSDSTGTAGSETAGSETAGSETAGSETAG